MNNYEILGVKRTATEEDIKKAYKNLVKKYHPDVYKGDKNFAEKKTSEINEAYEVLSNSKKRKIYDLETFPQQEYTYSPPKYNQTYDQYKHKYTNTYSYTHNENTNDGSEHDYYTYANYHHSQNYSNKTYDNYQKTENDIIFDKIYSKFNNLNKDVAKIIVIIIFLLYIFIIFYSLYQLYSLTNPNSKSKPNIFLNDQKENSTDFNYYYSNTIKDNSDLYYNNDNEDDEDDYTLNYNNTDITNNTNNTSKQNISSDSDILAQYINLYDIFDSEEELKNFYYEMKPYLPAEMTFEEFKNFLIEKLNPYN